jgi:hypothetical protein
MIMMAVTETVPLADERWAPPASERPFGLHWGLAILCSELLFIWCRASVQGSLSIDEVEYWIVGLTPFALYYLLDRFFSWQATGYLEVWMASLAVFLGLRIFGMAHFIEYPLFLRVDMGLGRSFAAACVYVASALVLVGAVSCLFKSRRIKLAELPLVAVLAIVSMAFGLFQPY